MLEGEMSAKVRLLCVLGNSSLPLVHMCTKLAGHFRFFLLKSEILEKDLLFILRGRWSFFFEKLF